MLCDSFWKVGAAVSATIRLSHAEMQLMHGRSQMEALKVDCRQPHRLVR